MKTSNKLLTSNSSLLTPKSAFTLVELIVVITILAILWTIAFISFEWYSKNARDGKRLSDFKIIEKNLELYITQKWTYPLPDNGINIMYDWAIAWTQWTVWDVVIRNLNRIDKKPVDPLTWNEYTYSVTWLKIEYQLWTIAEWWLLLWTNKTINTKIINQANAATPKKATAMIKWTYNEKILRVKTWAIDYILAVPSIISSNLDDVNLLSILSNNLLVLNDYWNLPSSYKDAWYTMTWTINTVTNNVLVYSGTIQNLNKEWNKLIFVDNLKQAYSGTILENNTNYSDIINQDITTNPTKSKELVNNYLRNEIGWLYQTNTNIIQTANTCILDWSTIQDGQIITAYNENNIVWNASYDCNDRKIIRICSDGELTWDSNYEYSNCVKWTPTNCNANANYTYNTHTYSIPAINHWQQATNIISTQISITNWIKTYTLTNIECNDGTLINQQEQIQANITCDTNYHTEDNETCTSNTRSCTITNGTWQQVWNNITSTWWICTVSTCDSWYVEQWNQCLNEQCNWTTPNNGKVSNATSQIWWTWTYSTTPWLCTYTCDTNYTWNPGTQNCDANTTTFTCANTKPSNTDWNTVWSYTQTWNGSMWTPAWTTTTYNTIWDTQSCRYTCSSTYHTEDGWISCISNTRTNQSCTWLPANAQYNNGTSVYSITQTWWWSWSPSTDAISSWYNATPTVWTCQWRCNTWYIQSWNTCIPATYTVSWSFWANANWATINVCGTNVTAASNWTFTATRNYGAVCNNITATRTGYTCSTTTNWPASLTANTTNIAWSCTLNTYTVSWSFWANANWATINVCGTNVTAASNWTFTATRNYGAVCNNITATRTWYTCSTTTNWPASLTSNTTNIAWNCTPINYTVTFNWNWWSGHSPATKSVAYNTAVWTLPSNPTRSWYTFNWWFTQAIGWTQITTNTIVTANVTWYAQWTQNTCNTTTPTCSPTWCTLTTWTPATPNQAWIKDETNCWFTCNANYSWANCETYTPPPFSCWDTVSAGWFTYTTLLWPDWKCWTSTNMKHWTMLANWSTVPSDTNTIEKWCYNNDTNICNTDWALYTWAEAMWFPASCISSNCTGSENTTKSVCGQLWTWWSLPTDTQWTSLTNAWATWWTWNKLSWIVSVLPGYRSTGGSFFSRTTHGYWWSSTEYTTSNSWYRYLYSGNGNVNRFSYNKTYGFSVVCIKN